MTRRSIASRVLEGIEVFTRQLETGEPIPVVRVRREETPDGPMHVREAGILRVQREDSAHSCED